MKRKVFTTINQEWREFFVIYPRNISRLVCFIVFILAVIPTISACDDSNKSADQKEPKSIAQQPSKIQEQALKRRHVLLLTVDTLRPDYLSLYGYDLPTSPFIDSLLSEGNHFTHALTPVPRTTQALANLLTGCYPHTTKLRTLFDSLSPEVLTIAQLARDRGFATIAVVSNHILTPRRNLSRGFDIYDFAGDKRDAIQTTNAAIKSLSSMRPADSIFLWVHYIDPHVPYYPHQESARRFDPSYSGRYADHFGAVRGGIGDSAYPADLGKVRSVYRNDLPDEVNAHIRRLYAADIRFTDDAIATLVKWLRQKFGSDWLIVFAADHGESLGEHNFFYDHGDYVYNASLRVPLAFIFPQGDPLHSVREVHDWVSLIDVMPTLVEILALDLPTNLPYTIEGRSLVPYLCGDALPPCAYFAECGKSFFPRMIGRRVTFDVKGRFRTAVLGDWKLIWTPGQQFEMEYELYNVATDPHETRNLYVPNHPEAKRLKVLLKKWSKIYDLENRVLADDDAELLRSLGYIQ